MNINIPMFQIDAFTSNVFSGNPAAVCLDEEWLSDETMMHIAGENNLSETAFIIEDKIKPNHYHIRWFKPDYEVDLCGHATLASSYVIFNELKMINGNTITFLSKSRKLSAKRIENIIQLNFPTKNTYPCEIDQRIISGLGITPIEVQKKSDFHLVLLENEDQVSSLVIDAKILASIPISRLIVTARGSEVDYVLRFFTPQEKRLEDPVTGSVQCYLAPYWAKKLNKKQFVVQQLSSRGGILFCELADDRVLIGGEATAYMQATISVPK